MKRWIAIILVVLVLGGVIYYNKFYKQQPGGSGGGRGGAPSGQAGGRPGGGPTAVNVFVVTSQNLKDEVVATGSLLASEQVDIYPEISGRIVELNIQEGRSVSQGTLLVKLYDGDLQAQLLKLRSLEENNRRIEERNKQLLQRGGISQQEYDIIVTNLKGTLADIEVTKAALRKTEIRAPFSGSMGLRNVSLGAVVSPNTLIARLQQTNSMKLDFSVPEKYGPSVKIGSVISFQIDGSDKTFNGSVYAIEPGVEEATRNLRIRARVNNNSSNLRPGTFAKVNLVINTSNALIVPTQSVIPQTRGSQVVVIKNGKAVFQDVKIGLRNASVVEVTQGLQKGDSVATTGLIFLRPESPVKVAKIEKLTGQNQSQSAEGSGAGNSASMK
ncbi:efflux RND transporter periplasmic adaptor subunit [Larkinella terrae]|uniref:Efflux RND transporter periplasmic adaptor subunit n=1 Tax=Larkinella terrae TaxID=2025311 RepID=A0A7K0EJG1_9BACT|nr:efflux RND transporter periplasmic adaptor subunit [Larkinella terrae]MRS61924.1 efflux RND transporter periplasmic adaptor subunit [Larkinella terrae]